MREIHREATYAIFMFEEPGGEHAAEAFIAAARRIVPTAWPVTAGALPPVEPAP